VWLTLILAVVTTVLTPISTNAGGWLYDLRRNPDPILREHAQRGGAMIYLLLPCWPSRLPSWRCDLPSAEKARCVTNIFVAVVVLAVGISSMIQVYRTGDAGSQAVWGNEIARLNKANGT
jgi:hypothetical protein